MKVTTGHEKLKFAFFLLNSRRLSFLTGFTLLSFKIKIEMFFLYMKTAGHLNLGGFIIEFGPAREMMVKRFLLREFF